MKVIISTENQAKVNAVKEVFLKVWDDIEFIAEKFPSAVSEQPTSEKEGVEGALNRANNSKSKYPEADYFVGMEGFVDTNEYGMFLAGAVVVIDRDGNLGIGFSAKMQLPDVIKNKILNGEELGPVVKEMMADDENKIRSYDGTNGILSKGLYNRVDEFKDATKCALARFVSKELYQVK